MSREQVEEVGGITSKYSYLSVPTGIDRSGLRSTSDRLAPAMMPVTEGKKSASSEPKSQLPV